MNTALLFLCVCLLQVCWGGQFIDFPFGNRTNKLFIPTLSFIPNRPFFVMLHGCTQNATDFATGTDLNKYAELYNFYVLYPEQPLAYNSAKCWNWFLPEDQLRGSGEPALIVAMANEVIRHHSIDTKKVFAGGLSAGAAMSVVLGATYPDFFAAIAVGAGLEYKAATDVISALNAMAGLGGPNATTQGIVQYNTQGSHAKTLAVLVVFGTADDVVAPINDEQVITSWAKTLDLVLGHGVSHGWITDTPTNTIRATVPNGRSFTTRTYTDKLTREILITAISVDGMNHAWSGGKAPGTFTDPAGPDASFIMVNWFLLFTSI